MKIQFKKILYYILVLSLVILATYKISDYTKASDINRVLSKEEQDWLNWFNSLSEEDQLAISYSPDFLKDDKSSKFQKPVETNP